MIKNDQKCVVTSNQPCQIGDPYCNSWLRFVVFVGGFYGPKRRVKPTFFFRMVSPLRGRIPVASVCEN